MSVRPSISSVRSLKQMRHRLCLNKVIKERIEENNYRNNLVDISFPIASDYFSERKAHQ
jgi:hypothetical protein